MAKVYGGRWELQNDKPLGNGGQALVFRVKDRTGLLQGEFALKRVLNPTRHERFKREIEAIKSLEHPNVINLIDHSALDGDSTEEKQFLVMPMAAGGDLSDKGRLSLYKNSIDGVLTVGRQIAEGLQAAHNANIIHRDIKPENILFQGIGNDIWICDFGICLLRQEERLTNTGEVVGPWAFMAPELEGGSQLDAKPAADIYSLGKLLYYMFSGGVTLPRERLDETIYSQAFTGERQQLLKALLLKMICPLGQRITSLDDVLRRIEDIQRWETDAQLLPIGQTALSNLIALQAKAREEIKIGEENNTARATEQQRLLEVEKGFSAWIESELMKLKAITEQDGTLTCSIRDINSQSLVVPLPSAGGAYIPIGGRSFTLSSTAANVPHTSLYVAICTERRINVSVTFVGQKPKPPEFIPPKDFNVVMVGFFSRTHGSSNKNDQNAFVFPTKTELIGQQRAMSAVRLGPRNQAIIPQGPLKDTTSVFSQSDNMMGSFKVSEWPFAQSKLALTLTQILDVFFSFALQGS